MKIFEAARSAPARYALLYAGVTALVISVLLAFIYTWTTSLLTRHLDQTTQYQLSILLDAYEQGDMPMLLTMAEIKSRRNTETDLQIVIQSSSGEFLLGTPTDFEPIDGWPDITVRGTSSDESNTDPVVYRSLGAYLDNGTFVLVMHDTIDRHQTQHLLTRSFASALAVTIAMALVGGLMIGDAMLRRVDAVNNTAKAIMKGDFTQRIPTSHRHDELGDLAENLNHLFSRIQSLMDDLRHVSSNIAHDLRSPLGRHRQKLESVLLDDRATEAECRAAMGAAIADVDSLLKTFDAMLQISEIETGRLRDRFCPVNLSHCVDNVVDAYAVVAEDQDKTILPHIDPNVMIVGDKELMVQAVVNIIENALRHTGHHARVHVIVNTQAGQPCLTITDNGPGIPENERNNVFQRFYRLDSSRSTPGSGLGLSFVKAVATLHRASVRLEDASPGLSVVIEFPAEASSPTTAAS